MMKFRLKRDPFKSDRNKMVENQLARRDITDSGVLDAMQRIPRHYFVPPEYLHMAYTDGPLPIGNNQTISQPYIVALMTQLMQIKTDHTVLEIGTGSGYQAAILGYLAKEVHSIERYQELARHAKMVIGELGFTNIHIHISDGTLGFPEFSPYDAIIVTAGAPSVPQPLFDQLADGGHLVIPIGTLGSQVLECWYKENGELNREIIAPVAFVPLIGKHGWKA